MCFSRVNAILALLICVLLVALYVRSQRLIETIEWTSGSASYMVEYASGLIMFDRATGADWQGFFRHAIQHNDGSNWQMFSGVHVNRAGFCFYTSPSGRSHILIVPFWFLGVLALLFPAVQVYREFKRWQRSRAVRQGRCAVCGYDLRATPDRCPECGTEPARISMNQPPKSNWWQRNWIPTSIVGCLMLSFLFFGGLSTTFTIVTGAIKTSDLYSQTLAQTKTSTQVAASLGQPVEPQPIGFPFGLTSNLSVNGPKGQADVVIPIAGPDGSATIYATATETDGKWTYSKLQVAVHGPSGGGRGAGGPRERIDLLLPKP